MKTRCPSFRSLIDVFWETFLARNVVLVQAMGLCPILAIGYDLKYGVALSVCTALVLLPANVLLSLFGEKLPLWLRPPVYAVFTSFLLLLAAFALHEYVSLDIYAALYLFLPLMAVNSLFTMRASAAPAERVHPLASLADALGASLGFALTLCAVSALREIAIYGTLWDIPLGLTAHFPEAKYPFIGYVLLGFMAAALQWLQKRLRRFSTGKGAVAHE